VNRINSYVVLTQIVCIAFVAFAFELVIKNSSVISPGGTLLAVLKAQPVYRLPVSIVGGLAIILILGSLLLYIAYKPKN
jgi:ABC-type transport system involved in cytochrome c biogenesis permease subunit